VIRLPCGVYLTVDSIHVEEHLPQAAHKVRDRYVVLDEVSFIDRLLISANYHMIPNERDSR